MKATLTVTYCNILQHAATYCNILQHDAKHLPDTSASLKSWRHCRWTVKPPCCNTLQNTATHCNTLQHTATCSTFLPLTATHWHTATPCSTPWKTATHCNTADAHLPDTSASLKSCRHLRYTGGTARLIDSWSKFKFLKSQIAAEKSMQNDNRADFWESLLVDAKNSEADRLLMTFSQKSNRHWIIYRKW